MLQWMLPSSSFSCRLACFGVYASGLHGRGFLLMAVRKSWRRLQVGHWNITFIDDDLTKVETSIVDAEITTFPLDVNTYETQFGGAGTFSNAACFVVSLNASGPVTSNVIPRSAYQANSNYR